MWFAATCTHNFYIFTFFYKAHPGEYIELVREPNNPYDRNAIRVDNIHGEKVGHIKATSARTLATIMDRYASPHNRKLRLEGIIPRKGNAYNLPLLLDFYSIHMTTASQADDSDNEAARNAVAEEMIRLLHPAVKYDYNFSFVYGNSTSAQTTSQISSKESVPKIERKKLDWNQQAKALDEMFDKQNQDIEKSIPAYAIPTSKIFRNNLQLFDYQIQGICWLVHREKSLTSTDPALSPFYKKVKEKGREMYLCEITQSSQPNRPKPISGGILADEMGLGKTLQTIGLILLSPPSGVNYIERISMNDTKISREEKVTSKEEIVAVPSSQIIRKANMTVLKQILKAASLKVSGKKQDLIKRIEDGVEDCTVKGSHFPASMFASEPSLSSSAASRTTKDSLISCRATLIVCPLSVMGNWQQQVNEHVPEGMLNVDIYHGPNRHEVLSKAKNGATDIVLASYHTLAAEYQGRDEEKDRKPSAKKMKMESILSMEFYRIILDEGHTIRSSKTKFFKAVKEIKSEHKLVLTGGFTMIGVS